MQWLQSKGLPSKIWVSPRSYQVYNIGLGFPWDSGQSSNTLDPREEELGNRHRMRGSFPKCLCHSHSVSLLYPRTVCGVMLCVVVLSVSDVW